MRWWRLRVSLLLASGVAAVVVTYDSSTLSGAARRPFGVSEDDYRVAVLVCIAVLGTSYVAAGFQAIRDRQRILRREILRNRIVRILFPVWDTVRVRLPHVADQRSVGLHVWLVPHWHWTLVPRWIRNHTPRRLRQRLPTPAMWCAGSLRIDRWTGPRANVEFRRDIGVIGRCWRERGLIHWTRAEWGPSKLDAAGWGSLDERLRQGLSYPQYEYFFDRYASVLALPIFGALHHGSDPELIGCVVVDVGSETVDLNTPRIQGYLASLSNSVSLFIANPY